MFLSSSLLLVVLCVLLCSHAVLSLANAEAGSKDSLSAQLDAELSNLSTSALINILEQQGMDIGDNYFTREELVRLIKMSLDREYSSDEPERDLPSQESAPAHKKSAPVVFDDDAPVWERVKQQMRADIEPFLALIPGPVKSYVHKELVNLGKTVEVLLRGAVSPMLGVAVKLLNRTAQLVLSLADRLKEHNQTLQEKQTEAHRNRKATREL